MGEVKQMNSIEGLKIKNKKNKITTCKLYIIICALQHPSELKIFKPQALKSHVYDLFGREMVDKEANYISTEELEFYKLEVEATTQDLP